MLLIAGDEAESAATPQGKLLDFLKRVGTKVEQRSLDTSSRDDASTCVALHIPRRLAITTR